MIVANDVSHPGTGFDSDTNEVLLVFPSGEVQEVARAPKRQIAAAILTQAVRLKKGQHAA